MTILIFNWNTENRKIITIFDEKSMRTIHFENPHRQKHFEFFNSMNHPHFCITTNVEITQLLPFFKENQIPITPGIVYLIAHVANQIQEFRWRIREDQVVEHESVHPSFAVLTEASDVFSFCMVEYKRDANDFVVRAQAQMEKMKTDPSFEDEPGRDDYLFLSTIPWVSYTSIQHAMHYHPSDSIPRITWGKFIRENNKILMPLSVQVHHAIVDGRHAGQYFQMFETLANNLNTLF